MQPNPKPPTHELVVVLDGDKHTLDAALRAISDIPKSVSASVIFVSRQPAGTFDKGRSQNLAAIS